MSTIIKIKRGNKPPTTNDLDYYELGFDTTNNDLYIKIEDETIDGTIVKIGTLNPTSIIFKDHTQQQ